MAWSSLIRLDIWHALPFAPAPRPHRRRPPSCPAADSAPGPAPAPSRAAAGDARPACGWFESSHELTHGLQVTEHAEPATVAQLVPLRWWLAWELDAASPAAPSRPSIR